MKNYSVVGNICETDTFAWDRPSTRCARATTWSSHAELRFEMSSILMHVKPAEVMVLDGKAHLIRRRDQFDDLLRNQVEVI